MRCGTCFLALMAFLVITDALSIQCDNPRPYTMVRPSMSCFFLACWRLRQIRPNAITCSTALSACDRGSLWRQGLQLLEEILQRGPVFPKKLPRKHLVGPSILLSMSGHGPLAKTVRGAARRQHHVLQLRERVRQSLPVVLCPGSLCPKHRTNSGFLG